MFRVIEFAIAGQLVGLLPVFAAALTVTLPGETTVTAVRFAGLAQRKRQVDKRENIIYSLALLLGASRSENHRSLRASQQIGGTAKLVSHRIPVIRSTRSGQ